MCMHICSSHLCALLTTIHCALSALAWDAQGCCSEMVVSLACEPCVCVCVCVCMCGCMLLDRETETLVVWKSCFVRTAKTRCLNVEAVYKRGIARPENSATRSSVENENGG